VKRNERPSSSFLGVKWTGRVESNDAGAAGAWTSPEKVDVWWRDGEVAAADTRVQRQIAK
jgi:hypothetical protein